MVATNLPPVSSGQKTGLVPDYELPEVHGLSSGPFTVPGSVSALQTDKSWFVRCLLPSFRFLLFGAVDGDFILLNRLFQERSFRSPGKELRTLRCLRTGISIFYTKEHMTRPTDLSVGRVFLFWFG